MMIDIVPVDVINVFDHVIWEKSIEQFIIERLIYIGIDMDYILEDSELGDLFVVLPMI